jgi:RNA polymerase sigma factor (sigma-70 family)
MRSVHERGAEDERLVLASRAGDESAFPALFDRWFDPCVDVAWRILHDRDAAADVAQETFLAAWRELDRLREPSSFGGWVLRTARNRALNRLAQQRRSAVVGDDDLTAALDGGAPGAARDRHGEDEPAVAAERAEGAELVWAASAALGERDASVLDLHLRHGFTAPEIAEALGVTANNAHQLLFRLKRKLGSAIQAWVLWPAASRPGVAGCAGLRQAIDDAGVTRFGPEAVRVIDGHARGCDACQDRRQLRVAPEVLFGAVPILPAGSILRARAAAALQADGVPMPAIGPNSTPSPGSSGSGSPSDSPGSGAGSGGVGSGDGDGDGDGGGVAGGTARRGRRARIAVGAVVAAIVVVGMVVAAAGGGAPDGEQGTFAVDDGADSTPDASSDETTTTVPATTVATTGEDGGTTVATDPPPGGDGEDTDDTDDTGDTTTPDPVVDPDPDPEPPEPDPESEPEPELEPEITRFTAVAGQPGLRPCQSAQRPVTLTWASSGADSASLAGPGAPTGAQPVSGQATACLDPGSQSTTYTLTVAGAGGTATTTATA